MKTTNLPGSSCPKCGKIQNRATSLEKNIAPKPGNISICLNCIAISKFDIQLRLVSLTPGELEELQDSREAWNEIVKLQSAIVSTWKDKGLLKKRLN